MPRAKDEGSDFFSSPQRADLNHPGNVSDQNNRFLGVLGFPRLDFYTMSQNYMHGMQGLKHKTPWMNEKHGLKGGHREISGSLKLQEAETTAMKLIPSYTSLVFFFFLLPLMSLRVGAARSRHKQSQIVVTRRRKPANEQKSNRKGFIMMWNTRMMLQLWHLLASALSFKSPDFFKDSLAEMEHDIHSSSFH